ncbi:hypothetical protein [Inhella gelatinilytica]|uniref:Uncharacterized protein n=1 Tax=Inhella gelatinilytica TaxID=2795030 RepID=A0A931IYA1_9BURK|nr:hypothetical protein [Inhella gelatinilytica]MBH9553289.1 hypothetical protein [Inhella gelatinilytica]
MNSFAKRWHESELRSRPHLAIRALRPSGNARPNRASLGRDGRGGG